MWKEIWWLCWLNMTFYHIVFLFDCLSDFVCLSVCLTYVIQTVGVPFTEKTRDGQPVIEYHEEDVQDTVMEALIRQAYRMYTVSPPQLTYRIPICRSSEMTFGLIKDGKLPKLIMHNNLWANQKIDSLCFACNVHKNCLTYRVMCFPAFVRMSGVMSGVLLIC